MIDSFAIRDISVSQFCIHMNFAVTGVKYFTVFMDGSAFAVQGEHKVNDNSDHQTQSDQKHHSHLVEPLCGLHFPGNAA